jgi:hypothetical protein
MGYENFKSSLPVQLPHQLIYSSTSAHFSVLVIWLLVPGAYLEFGAWDLGF